MKFPQRIRRLIPGTLGAAMFAVIVVAALTPNVGVVSAQVNAQYTSVNQTPTLFEYALIGILVVAILAAIIGLLVFRRRNRGGPGGEGGVAAWEQPPGGSPGSTAGTDYTGGPGGLSPAGAAGYGAAGAGVAAGAYDESASPEAGPDWVEPAEAGTLGAGAGAAAGSGEEPDIDRLMKELDQISDDILKKTPPKRGLPPP